MLTDTSEGRGYYPIHLLFGCDTFQVPAWQCKFYESAMRSMEIGCEIASPPGSPVAYITMLNNDPEVTATIKELVRRAIVDHPQLVERYKRMYDANDSGSADDSTPQQTP